MAHLDAWHSRPETFDNELDRQLHRWYADAPAVYPRRPYFSPSSANACPRELYVRQRGAKRDITGQPPYQGRWVRLGTAVGDMIQRDLLFMERHYDGCPFRFERTADGRPMFEDFAKVNKRIERGRQAFYLYGTCDGILEYTAPDGGVIRVGLEIKSKQTTAARTSLRTMRSAEESHVAQTVAYSIMYDVDYYVILYVNAAKKSWVIDEDEYAKSPDIRAFGIEISDDDREALLDRLAGVMEAVNTGNPPPLDLDNFTFNSYKTACALDLSDDEMDALRRRVEAIKRSRMPAWRQERYIEAVAEIEKIRKEAAGE